MLRGDWYAYNTSEVKEPYHRPTYKVTADASFNIYKKVLLDFDAILQGGAIGYDFTETLNNGAVELDQAIEDLWWSLLQFVIGSSKFKKWFN